jgi:hypothetical protein
MISRMTIPAGLLVAAVCILGTISPSMAQGAGIGADADAALGLRGVDATPKTTVKPVKKPAPARVAKTTHAKPADKPKEMEPWAAVDPTRAGFVDEKAATLAPMPGVEHPAPTSEGAITPVGKVSVNNTPNYGPMSTAGLMNKYDSTVNGGIDPGTTVETGLKFKF